VQVKVFSARKCTACVTAPWRKVEPGVTVGVKEDLAFFGSNAFSHDQSPPPRHRQGDSADSGNEPRKPGEVALAYR
jgi:hypothetical protein